MRPNFISGIVRAMAACRDARFPCNGLDAYRHFCTLGRNGSRSSPELASIFSPTTTSIPSFTPWPDTSVNDESVGPIDTSTGRTNCPSLIQTTDRCASRFLSLAGAGAVSPMADFGSSASAGFHFDRASGATSLAWLGDQRKAALGTRRTLRRSLTVNSTLDVI